MQPMFAPTYTETAARYLPFWLATSAYSWSLPPLPGAVFFCSSISEAAMPLDFESLLAHSD